MAYRKQSLPVGVISCRAQRFEANSIALTLLLLFLETEEEVNPANCRMREEARIACRHHLKLYWR